MSFILKQNGVQVAISGGWNPNMFADHAQTSFPESVGNDYVWAEGEFDLRWEADPEPTPPDPSVAILEQIADLEAQFTTTMQMRAFLGNQDAIDEMTGLLTQIDALKGQL